MKILILLSLLVCTAALPAQVGIGSPDQVPANSPAQGRTDYIAFGFGAQKTVATTYMVSNVTFQNLGTAQQSDWVRIRLIKDVNTNSVVDAGDVVLSSVNATTFPVTFPPLPPGDSIPMQPAASVYLVAIDIAAGAVVGRTFQLQILNNADFAVSPSAIVQGAPLTGNIQTISAPSQAEMDIQRNSVSIAAGATDNIGNRVFGTAFNVTWTVLNTGTQNLTLQGNPQIFLPSFAVVNCGVVVQTAPAASVSPSGQTTFTLQITVTAAGPFGFLVRIDNNDFDENAYPFIVTGTGTLPPEMDVLRGAAPLADGGTDTVAGAIVGVATVLTYTINNTGTGPLSISTPVAAPGAQTNCVAVITTQPSATVNPAGTTTLVISVTPGAAGAFSFTVSIDNNDLNENPYNWTASGTAAGPEMDVFRAGGAALADGATDARGTLIVAAAALVSFNYEVRNTGQAALTVSAPVIGSLVNCSVVAIGPAASIPAAGQSGLTLDVTVGIDGPFSFTVSMANNDANENPYNWTVTGTWSIPAPEIEVLRGLTPVANAGNDAIGMVASFVPLNLVYTVANSGTADLALTGLPVPVVLTVVANLSAANISTQPSSIVGSGGSTTFTITYTLAGPGPFSMDISIANDDANENPYEFTISGTGMPGLPEIGVARDAVAVVDGGAEVLGSRTAGVAFALVYDISNTGMGPLTITPPVTISGTVNCSVTVTAQPSATVNASGTTTLELSVTPAAAGAFSFQVSIDNDDANESPYDWSASGQATTPPSPGGSSGSSGCAAGPGLLIAPLAMLAALAIRRRRQ